MKNKDKINQDPPPLAGDGDQLEAEAQRAYFAAFKAAEQRAIDPSHTPKRRVDSPNIVGMRAYYACKRMAEAKNPALSEFSDSDVGQRRRPLTAKDLKRINLGKVFWTAKTEKVQGTEVRKLIARYRKNIAEMIETGSGLVLQGPPGVGKTAAAACLIKEAVSAGMTTYFVTHAELKELRFEQRPSLFGDGADGITIKKRIETAQLLVLDGFNENFFVDKQFGPIELEELLIGRNDRKLASIITFRSVGAMKEKHSSLFDVMSHSMFSAPMEGADMRSVDRAALAKRMMGEG